MAKLPERRFAHEPVYCKMRGRIKVYCRCGEQSDLLPDLEQAVEAYKLHVGLKELEQKVAFH